MLQDDPLARRERCVQGRRVLWLDTDDECLGPQRLDVSGDAGDEPAAAHAHEDRVEGLALLAHDLHRHRSLACDDVLVVIGGDQDHSALGGEGLGPLSRAVIRIARGGSTSAPSRSTASTLMRGAVSGMTMSARAPSHCAASATPCA